MDEATLSRKIKLALHKEFPGCYFVKIAGGGYQQSGLPDLVGCVYGRYVGIEVKLPHRRQEKGAVTALQQETLSMIHAAGGLSFVAYDVKEAVERVRTFLYAKGIL